MEQLVVVVVVVVVGVLAIEGDSFAVAFAATAFAESETGE